MSTGPYVKHVPQAIKNFDIGYKIDIIDSTFRHYCKEFSVKKNQLGLVAYLTIESAKQNKTPYS